MLESGYLARKTVMNLSIQKWFMEETPVKPQHLIFWLYLFPMLYIESISQSEFHKNIAYCKFFKWEIFYKAVFLKC